VAAGPLPRPAPAFTATIRDAPPSVADDEPSGRFTLGEAARGVVLAALAQALAGVMVLFVAVLRLAGSGHDGLSLTRGSMGPLLLAAGFGFGTAYALIALNAATNGSGVRLRNTTIVLALALAAAWPLSGLAVAAAPLATVAIGLAAAYDRVRPPARAAPPIPTGLVLAVVSIALMISSAAGAETHDRRPRPAPAPSAPRTPAAPRPKTEAPRPAPSSTPGASAPADFVAAYYRALDARRFRQAWQSLSPAVHQAFGGFAHWKAGFATTLASRPERITARGLTVHHVLVARDKSACGPVERRFAMTWRLARTAEGLSAVSLHGAPLGRPTANC
jgi:hypothetical protein